MSTSNKFFFANVRDAALTTMPPRATRAVARIKNRYCVLKPQRNEHVHGQKENRLL